MGNRRGSRRRGGRRGGRWGRIREIVTVVLRPILALGLIRPGGIVAGIAALIVLRPVPARLIGAGGCIGQILHHGPRLGLVGFQLVLHEAELAHERDVFIAAVALQRGQARPAPLADAVVGGGGGVGVEAAFGLDIRKDPAGNRLVASHLRAQEGVDRQLVALRSMGGEHRQRTNQAQQEDPADQSFLHAILLYKWST